MSALRRALSRVRPWVVVAALLAVVILGYHATLAVRYWEASRRVTSLTGQAERLSLLLRQPPPDQEALELELQVQRQRLETLSSGFPDMDTDALMALLSSTAVETGIDLTSIATGDLSPGGQGGSITRPMTLTLRGETGQVHQFLLLLHQRVATITVASLRLAGIDGIPSAQVQILFHLLPRAAPKG